MSVRLVALALLLASSAPCAAEPVNSVREAWTYLTRPGKPERWVTISSSRNDGYFQCANMDTFVQCPMAVWIKRLPERRGRYRDTNSRRAPHPEVPGSQERRMLADAQVTAARAALRRLNVELDDVHSQIVDEQRRVVGTAYDVRLALDFDFKQFDKVVDAYMSSAWNTSPQEYRYTTDN